MRLTCFALLARLAVLAAAQNPCALECRRQTCSSLNHSFSCEELSGFGCDCVSRCGVLKPHAHSRSRASHTDRRPRTHTGGLLRRRAGSLLAAAVSTTISTPRATRASRAPGGAPPPPVATGPAVATASHRAIGCSGCGLLSGRQWQRPKPVEHS